MNIMYKSYVSVHIYMLFLCSFYALENISMYVRTSLLMIYNMKIYICVYISTSIFVLSNIHVMNFNVYKHVIYIDSV